ncbi:MAG: hypothetical protein GQ527_02045 [Bacteroidales bacterium]|nr:hypothetical protein [Bacteroidales bacterium]
MVFPCSDFYQSEFLDEGIAILNAKDSLQYFYNYHLQNDSNYSEKAEKSSFHLHFSLSNVNFSGGIDGLFLNDTTTISNAYCKHYVKYTSQLAFVASHKGIIELSTQKNQVQIKHHFTDWRITHLLVDYHKNLWVATADNGIFMIHRNALKSSFFSKNKANGEPLSCWRFSEIDHQLFTTTEYGLVPVEQDNWQSNPIYLSTKNLACNAAIEGDDFIIIGTRSSGIYKLKNKQLEQIFVNDEHQLDNIIVQIEKNEKGFLASSKHSFIQLDHQGNYVSQTTTDFNEAFAYTMEFYQYPKGIMNSRTTGIIKLDADINIIEKYKNDSVQVVSMMRPYQNEWWGVSMDAGLLIIENNQLLKKAFPDKRLFTLTNWKNTHLWISGIQGIYQYSQELVRPFLSPNGFPIKEDNQNAVYKDSLGFLYYAGVGGIQKFHPDSLLFFPSPPTVLLEYNSLPLNTESTTSLKYDQSQVILNVHPISISNQNYFKIEVGTDSLFEVKHPKQLNFALSFGNNTIQVKITDIIHQTFTISNYHFHRAIPVWKKSWFIILIIVVIIHLAMGLASFIGFLKTRKQNKHAQIRIEEQQKGLKAVIQAQEDERKRIAKDLHDGIVQQLGGLKLGLQKIFTDNQNEETIKIVNILDNSAQELRELSHKMMPRSLGELGLIPSLTDMLENSLGHTDISYEFEHFGINDRFKENIEIAIYRIAQELVNNIIKHSQANKANIQLIKTGNHVLLIVEDNGKGMNLSKHKDGIGLMNIASRLDTINGKVNYEPSPESGTLATIKIPVS